MIVIFLVLCDFLNLLFYLFYLFYLISLLLLISLSLLSFSTSFDFSCDSLRSFTFYKINKYLSSFFKCFSFSLLLFFIFLLLTFSFSFSLLILSEFKFNPLVYFYFIYFVDKVNYFIIFEEGFIDVLFANLAVDSEATICGYFLLLILLYLDFSFLHSDLTLLLFLLFSLILFLCEFNI
jgi:hypothetical protein